MPKNMEAVKSFNDELSSIYESKPPVSRAKMTALTKKAIKGIKFYKHIVQSMEKFIQKCRPEYKVPGLYVIDSVVRQSRHQFGQEKDVFMPRLCKNIINTFKHLYKCPAEEKQRITRVLFLWQKNSVFPPEIVQQLLAMGGESSTSSQPVPDPVEETGATAEQTGTDASLAPPDAGALTSMLAQLLANPNNPQIQQLTGLLSSSQQAQLQTLVSRVNDQQENEDVKTETIIISDPDPDPPSSSVFQPPQNNSQPPFLHSSADMQAIRNQPSFNPAILDYDYSDDESPKVHQETKHKPGIDLELLAKLPTVDQLKQLPGFPGEAMSNGNSYTTTSTSQQFQNATHDSAFAARDIDDRMRPGRGFVKEEMSDEVQGSRDERSRSTSGRRRSRSKKRSRSRSRDRHRHRRRSRSRDRHRSRRSRSPDRHRSHHQRPKERNEEREKEIERENKGFPPLKEGCISLCSKTIWIGNLASKVSQQEIKTEVESSGPIESINMIPPRGCAYICMETREDASKAVQRLKHQRIGGKMLKVDWAPGKEVKPEYKEYWSKEYGVNYIPLDKVGDNLVALKSQGFIDLQSVPEEKRAQLDEISEQEALVLKEEKPEPMSQPPMMPMSGMMGGGMPVMMRPSFPFPGMNPAMRQFVPQQRMTRFQLAPSMQNPTPVPPAPTPPSPQKPEESKIPLQEEKLDGAQKAAAVAASIMSSVQQRMPQPVISVAQRFPAAGQMPMEIRMIPGMPGPSPMLPPHRIGMVPIRMGLPMQLRPGFARVPVPQTMVPFQQQMPRMGQMMPRGPMPIRMQGRPLDEPELGENKEVPELENRNKETDMDRPNEGLGMLRPPLGRPPMEDRPMMGERMPMMDRMPMGERPPMGDNRMHPLGGGRPPLLPMDDRPRFGFRRSPPGRFGFDHRLPMNGPDGPRFMNRDRFMDRGMGDRHRDGMRRRSPERSRERDRFDRGMRERRFDEHREFGGWGRERGRFGGRDDMRGRGRGRGFNDRSRDRDGDNDDDGEYKKKREEVLRKRRDGEGDYVSEDIDLSSFGLPSGFGGKTDKDGEEESRDRDEDRRRDRGRRDDRDRRDRRRDDRDRDRRRERRRSRDRDRDRRDDRRESQDNKRRKVEDSEEKSESKDETAKHDEPMKSDPNPIKTEEQNPPEIKSEPQIKVEPVEKRDCDVKNEFVTIIQGEPPIAAPAVVKVKAEPIDVKPSNVETTDVKPEVETVEAPTQD